MKSACGVTALDSMLTALGQFTSGFARASGVTAFDSVVGGLTGRTSDLSMATLCQMAQDNGMLLFPHRMPVEFVLHLPSPYILLHKHHYTAIKKLEDLPEGLGSNVHVLMPYALADFLMDIVEARELRGSKNFFSQIGAEFKRAARNPYVQVGVGLATGNPWLAAGLGAYGGSLEGGGLGGAVRGGVSGGLAGLGGAGLGGALGGAKAGFTAAGMRGIPGGLAKGFGAGTTAGMGRIFSPFSAGFTPSAGAQAVTAGFTPTLAPGQTAPGGVIPSTGPTTREGVLATSGTNEWAAENAKFNALPDFMSGKGEALNLGNQIAQSTGAANFQEFFKSTSGKFGIGSFLTSALIPSPEYTGPEVNADMIAELAKRGPMTPSGKAVEAEVQKVLGAPYGTAYTAISEPYARRAQELLSKQFDVEKKATTERYASAGALDSGEYREAMAKLDNQNRQEVANIHADVAVKLAAAEGDLRASFAQIGLQLDRQTMGDLLGITGMQVEQAATQYGAQVADVNSLRSMFSGLGTLFTSHALGLTGGQGGGGMGNIIKALAA